MFEFKSITDYVNEVLFNLIHFRHNKTNLKKTIEMENGSIIVMGGAIQHHWKHQVPKTSKVKSTRINMTFRSIIG